MSKFVLTAQLQLQAPNNVSQIVSQIQNQLNNVSVNVQVQGSAQANKQLQQITQSTNAATTAAGRMGNAFAVSIRRFAAFSIATRAVGLFTSTLADAVKTAIDFERELIKISQVTGRSVSSLRDLTDSVTSLATGFGVTSGSLLEVTTVLTQAGLSSDDTKIALESLAKAALAPNFDSISETAEGAIAILAQFKQGVGALEGQLSSIDAVAGAFAVEAGDLIDVIRRSGGVFKASGGSLNELLALFTSVRATTRESAESIGTGLRTIFTRIQRPETIEFLKQFGVELVDLNGKFVGPYEAIKRLSEAISGLGEGDLTFIKIAEELGGFRQIGKVLPLLQQFSTAQAALNVAQNAGNGLTQNAISAQASLAIRIIKVKEEFLALVRSMTETPTFQIMANSAIALASALIKIADSIKPLLPLLGAVAAFKAVKGIGSFVGGIGAGLASGKTFNTGGKVLAFAKGGLVPGSGSGTADDIPAMVSSGEFVMKKSAVQRIGANNLAEMNRGGTVQKLAVGGIAKSNIVGMAVPDTITKEPYSPISGKASTSLSDVLNTKTGFGVLASKSINDLYRSSSSKKFIAGKLPPEDLDALAQKELGFKTTKTYDTLSEGVTQNDSTTFNTIVDKRVKESIKLGASDWAKSVGVDLAPDSLGFADTFQLPGGFKGSYFESVLDAFQGRPIGAEAAEANRPFDFTKGLKPMGTLFDQLASKRVQYIDAKISGGSNINEGQYGKKITNQLALDLIEDPEFTQQINSMSQQRIKQQSQTPKAKHFGGIIQKFAVGGLAKPKDTLQKYFEDAAPINLGLSNSKALSKDQRKQLASDTRDLRKLRTSAPTELYSSISRSAFDKFAMDTGLNKNPEIPQGTKFNNRQSYYAPEVAKTIGKTFSLPGFVSTSKNYTVAKSFLDNAPRSEDNWAAMLTIATKKNAQGVDVAEQLKDRKINVTKQDINPRTGKMDTFFMKQPSEENEFMLSPRSRFRVDKARYVDLMGRHNLWANVQQLAVGGRAKGIEGAPLVDDIPNASGSILPRPSAAIQALIKAGGGAVDVDRTIKRTVGDTAYAKAPTPGAKEASLNTYFRDEAKRLQDLQSAPVTQFGKELKVAIQSGQLDARKISIISKSKRVKGAAEYLSSQFGIPVQNMVFTQGASKQPALDAIRNKGSRIERVKRFLGGIIPQRFALGGMGKAPRKVDYESGVGPSPFASQKSNKLGQEVYALQKSSGLNNLEFGDIVQTANTLGYNTIPQFKQYLAQRVAEKKNKSQLKTDVPSLLSSLKDDGPQAKPRQLAMAQQLSGPEATPQTKRLSPQAEKLRIMLGGKPKAFAAGGLVPGVGNSDTVPATLQEGDFVIRKSSVSKLGAENLASMAGYAAGGNVSKSVPALLTPGEFVFDEPSAKSIGYGNLNRMNKVGKYAKGGFVGVQKFAAGTSGKGAKAGVGAPIGASGGLFSLDIGDKIVKDLDFKSTGSLFRQKLLSIAALLMGGGKELSTEMLISASQLDILDSQVSGLAKAVIANGEANKRSVQGQAALIDKMKTMNFNQLTVLKDSLEADTATLTQKTSPKTSAAIVSSAAQSTASSSQTSSSSPSAPSAPLFQRRADGSVAPVDANSGGSFSKAEKKQLREQYKASQSTDLVPMTRQEKAASNGTLESGLNKNSAKLIKDRYDKLYAEEKALISKEYAQKASDAQKQGKDTAAILAEYKQTLAEAKQAITKGANAALADAQASNKQTASNVVNNVGQGGTPNQKILQTTLEKKAEKGQVTNLDLGKGMAEGLNQAQLKAIVATNAQAVAAQKAAQANLQEASASDKAAASDMKESMSNGGTKDLGSFAMGLSLVSGTLQSLLPPIDESSSVFVKMTSSGLTLITTLSGIAFSLSAFGINLNAGTIASAASAAASFLQGTAGTAAAAATTALATTAATSSVTLTGMSVTSGFATASLLKLAASALAAASNMLSGIGKFVGPLVNAAGPLLAFAAGGALAATGLNLLVSEIYGVSDKLKKSIGEGNVEQAGKLAGQQYDVDSGNVTRMLAGVVTAIGVGLGTTLGTALGTFAGPVVGNIAGGIIGGLAGAAVATALINTFSGIAETVNVLFGGNTRDSTIALAQAQAQAVATQKALTASGENATKAMTDLQNGAISAAQAVAATSGGGDAVLKENQINKKAAEENEKNKSGTLGGIARGALRIGTLGLAGYMGVESGAQRNARIDTENKGMSQQSKKSQETLIQQSTPAINALSGDIAAAGGTFEDVMAQIQATNPGLYFSLINQGSGDLAKSFDNIKKEVERAQKAFNAMNLGMQNVQGAAAAAALGVNNYIASQQAGNVGLEQSLAVLEASVTSAAQGISDADFGKALSDADATLASFGASKEQREKFSGNISAVNEVQKNQSTIFAGAKDKLAADIRKSNSADERKKIFSQSVDDQLKASGYDEETRKRFKDATGNMSDDQLKKIGEGDFTAFEESINELGKKTMEQVSGPLKAAIEIQKQLNELTKQRIEAERQLVSAQLEASNVRMEAMDIAAQYGGPKVTPEMRAQNIAQQANIQSRGIKGVADIQTGSAQELSTRTQQLSNRQAEIAGIRMKAAAGDSAAQKQLQGESGLQLQEEEKKIQDAAKSQVQATRDLIKSKQEELKIIKEKNQLEKSSIDALVSGDIEKFFDQQAAVGAQAAIATGDQRLIGQFGMSALGGAAQETKRQQEAGVQELYGQKLSGPGGLTERAYGSAISAAGVQNPLAMAQVAAGSTGAEAAVESDIRDLAATMGPAADIQVEAANNQVLAAQMQLDAARAKGEEAVSQMQARQMATGGVVYANRGIFVPRGTDTVPAMLTPGEFVVRREAVQRGNNLQMLQSMNRGSNVASDATGQSSSVAMMATGGIVRYRENGSTGPEKGGGGFGLNLESLGKLAEALTNFNSQLATNITNLTNTKFTIKLDTTNVNVNLNGGSFLKDLTDTVKSKLMEHVGEEIKNYSVGDGGKLIRTGGSTLPTSR